MKVEGCENSPIEERSELMIMYTLQTSNYAKETTEETCLPTFSTTFYSKNRENGHGLT